jgi:hypothetical protein
MNRRIEIELQIKTSVRFTTLQSSLALLRCITEARRFILFLERRLQEGVTGQDERSTSSRYWQQHAARLPGSIDSTSCQCKTCGRKRRRNDWKDSCPLIYNRPKGAK